MQIPTLGNKFHIARDFGWRSKKRFFPGGFTVPIRDFQYALKKQKSKIGVSFMLIGRHDLASIIFLGKPHLFEVQKIASYLYKHAIHPRFFAEALSLITANAKELKPGLLKIQLMNLRRDRIAQAIDENKLHPLDIGIHYHLFSRKTVAERLEILQKLGVIILKDDTALPKEEEPPILKEIRPRPPIRRTPAHKIRGDRRQLDIFSEDL